MPAPLNLTRSTSSATAALSLYAALAALCLALLPLTGCFDGATSCESDADCFVGETCRDSDCVEDTASGEDMEVPEDMTAPDMSSEDMAGDMTENFCPKTSPDFCGGTCVDLDRDPRFCGRCDNSCEEGEVCQMGDCKAINDCRQEGCSGFSWCDTNDGKCKPGCADDDACLPGESCNAERSCVCSEGFHRCDGVCRADDDPDYCGDACISCPSANGQQQACVEDICQQLCEADQRYCAGACADCPEGMGIETTACMADMCVISSCADGYEVCQSGCCELMSDCPNAVAVVREQGSSVEMNSLRIGVNRTAELDGSKSTSTGTTINSYQWSIVSKPMGSQARLMPNNAVVRPTLTPDRPGDYIIELKVSDTMGTENCNDNPRVTVTAIAGELLLQLTWVAPLDGDPNDDFGTDLDLHYLHPMGSWNNQPWDVYWLNKRPDWGMINNADDDPSLDLDSTKGPGPEIISHAGLENANTYSVGVYYYSSNNLGQSLATLEVFVDNMLVFDNKQAPKVLLNEGSFWHAVDIRGSNLSVRSIDSLSAGFPP